MRIPKAALGVFLALVLVAAGIHFLVFSEGPAEPENQAENPAAKAGLPSPGPGKAGASGESTAPDQKVEAAPLPVKVAKAIKGDLVMTLKSPGEDYTE